MINKAIDDLFNNIYNSSLYKEYIIIKKILDEDEKINILINEIKDMQKKATCLEYNKDNKYISIDKEIKDKLNILNNNVIYKEYINKVSDLNEMLNTIKNIIEGYINEL